MTHRSLGPAVAVFGLAWRRDTGSADEITAAIHRHVGAQLTEQRQGESFRSGNVLAVHVLGADHVDPTLLLVSTDIGWSNRNQAAIDALSESALVENRGQYSTAVTATNRNPADPVRDLGADVRVFRLRPAPDRSADEVTEAVATQLRPLVGAPPVRASNILHVSLLRPDRGDEHLLLFGVDIGDSPRNQERLAAVGQVAEIERLGSYQQHLFTVADPPDRASAAP